MHVVRGLGPVGSEIWVMLGQVFCKLPKPYRYCRPCEDVILCPDFILPQTNMECDLVFRVQAHYKSDRPFKRRLFWVLWPLAEGKRRSLNKQNK